MKNREKNLWKAISFMNRLEQKVFERNDKIKSIHESWKELKNKGTINKRLGLDDKLALPLSIKETQNSLFNMVYLPSGTFYTGIKDKTFEEDCKKTQLVSCRKKVEIERPFFIMDTCVNESLFLDVFMNLNDNLEYAIDLMNLKFEMGNVHIFNNPPTLSENKIVNKFSWLSAILFCNILSQRCNYEKCYEIKIPDTPLNRKRREDLISFERHKQYSMSFVESISHYVDIDVVWNKNANGFRLPTAKEWEYAAKYPNDCLYFGGQSSFDDENNLKNNPCFTKYNQLQKYKYSLRIEERTRYDYQGEQYNPILDEFFGELKIFKPNVLGIFDMLRYEEICFDVYCKESYDKYLSYNDVDLEVDTYINKFVLGKEDIVKINFAYRANGYNDEEISKSQNKSYMNVTKGKKGNILPNNSHYYLNDIMRGSSASYPQLLKALRPVRNA